MKIILRGCRGSLPTPLSPADVTRRLAETLQGFRSTKVKDINHYLETLPRHMNGGYGGNTSCTEVRQGNESIIIDGGTGLRNLDWQSTPLAKGKGEIHIFFTHFHWDHVMGLPFFPPLYIPGNKIHTYAVQPDLEKMFQVLFKRPYFPVELARLGASLEYHTLLPRQPLQLGDFVITPYQLDHPDPCWGYRVEAGEKAYAHCVDTETIRFTREELGADLPLYQNVDLMVYDSQYSFEEAQEKKNWGHASAPRGLQLAMREKIQKVIFVHHDPMALDEHIFKTSKQAVAFIDKQENLFYPEWDVGYENMELDL